MSMRYYIMYMNRAKGYLTDYIWFDSWEEAKAWALANLERYDPDMIHVA
jgi:hypothetical protein